MIFLFKSMRRNMIFEFLMLVNWYVFVRVTKTVRVKFRGWHFLLFFHLWSWIIIKSGTLLLYNIFFLIILTFKSSKSVKNWQSYATFFFASKILAQYVNNVTHDAKWIFLKIIKSKYFYKCKHYIRDYFRWVVKIFLLNQKIPSLIWIW